jgi:hypothetical protein
MNGALSSTTTNARLADTVRLSTREDGAVLLNTHSGEMFTLNAVGARMVALLAEGHNYDQVVVRVCIEYSAPPERVRLDLDQLVAALRERGLFST